MMHEGEALGIQGGLKTCGLQGDHFSGAKLKDAVSGEHGHLCQVSPDPEPGLVARAGGTGWGRREPKHSQEVPKSWEQSHLANQREALRVGWLHWDAQG